MKESFIIETKYDGERLQCHFDEHSMRMFSRNCHDVTEIYGQALNEVIRKSVNAKAAILDGEVVVVDKQSFKPAPFGKNKQVALEESRRFVDERAEPTSSFQLCCNDLLRRFHF